jgi:hypothetical protein
MVKQILDLYDADAPLERASTIPAPWYTDPRVLELEFRTCSVEVGSMPVDSISCARLVTMSPAIFPAASQSWSSAVRTRR